MNDRHSGPDPLVTLIIATYNRRRYLPESLRSAVNQTYSNLQILVARDGGDPVDDIVASFDDPRIEFLDRDENRGYAATLNETMKHVEGKYVAYLGDDDFHYPEHVSLLARSLEENPEYGAAYSNLVRTTFRLGPDGKRFAVSKRLEIRRDFDRMFMFYFNQALGGSLMHRRDLLERTGPYNEQVKVLIDWDMTRRLSFFTDFLHVDRVTGEYCIPEDKAFSDRISNRMRQDPTEFNRHFFSIRTARPAKPWPRVRDLSLILAPDHMTQAVADTITSCVSRTCWPFLIYLAMPAEELAKLKVEDFENSVVRVPTPPGAPEPARVDAALAACEGEYAAIVPVGLPMGDLWVEHPLNKLMRAERPKVGFLIAHSTPQRFAAVFRKEELTAARSRYPALSVFSAVTADGIEMRFPRPEDSPLHFDTLLHEALRMEEEGDWRSAVRMYENCRQQFANDTWMNERIAWALWELGSHDDVLLDLCRQIRQKVPTVESRLLEAQVHRRSGRTEDAIRELERARDMLRWAV